LVCRQRTQVEAKFVRKLERLAGRIDGLHRLLLWSVDMPLGKPDEPSEAHPLTVRGAPGKDRLETPQPDPQTGPLGQFQIYELLHNAFLTRARAVMNLDVHDMLAPNDGPSVFDLAVQSNTGLVQLLGEQCYPWRVKKDQPTAFGDHIYVRFDEADNLRRWCVCPKLDNPMPVWRVVRVIGADPIAETRPFHRFMAIKHPIEKVARIVPKSSLIESDVLLDRARKVFDHKPVMMPKAKANKMSKKSGTAIVTTMKNEGPFILEWLAYHRVIGVDRFMVYTNDCTDGTDTLLEVLQSKGLVQHRDNKFEGTGLKPQHNAFRLAENEDLITSAEWVICMDVDEYITVKTGDGTLDALYQAIGDANMVAINWRLFGNNNVHEFSDRPIIEQFTKCAPEFTRKPHQAWGFKTLFKNTGIFKKLGVHRPKGL
ncbi:MAG: glycosyltransferase family 2 protein, partial [Pseudomonadota bacterium]